ncbi:MAG: polysaccharide pyruvyl transferase family protein [Methylobacteriaceae bacterium]|nr:polysaccharide pyruvyl transferase family protein [Methylobacteriaceae bacterium]
MRIFLLGATPSISVPPDAPWDTKLARTGGNTGNQVIAHSLLRELAVSEVSWDYSMPPEKVGEEYDLFVIAAANFLHAGCDLGGMAQYIEATQLPCLMVGLGAQSNSYEPRIELKPGTERLVRVVAERTRSIGVRGPFTQAVLDTMGIRNVQVTGCPSYYVSCEPTIAIDKGPLPERPKVAINASRDVYRHSFDAGHMERLVRELVAQGIALEADFVAQSEGEEIVLAENRDAAARERALERLTALFAGAAPDAALRDWFAQHMRVYFSVEDWAEAIRSYDFVAGTRFHGCILALQNRVPAFVICHDTRTADMCAFLGLPHVNMTELDHVDIRELHARADLDGLKERYATLYPAYKAFLEGNGVAHRLA